MLVLLILAPLFDTPPEAGALIEMSFAGGHGTLAGLSDVFADHGVGELLDVGLGLATIGMVAGVVIGTLLVNYAVKSPIISVARQNPTSPSEDLDIDHHTPSPDDPPMDESRGMSQLTAAAVFIGVSIAVGIVVLEALRWATNELGSTIFDQFPLFPFTIIGGVIVQLCAVRFDFEWAVNRRAVEGIGGLSVDGIIICAIGTLSLGALADNLPLLIIMAIGSIAWSVFLALVVGRASFAKDWFEHSIAEFGESQGNVATGFMLVDMVDPARTDQRHHSLRIPSTSHPAIDRRWVRHCTRSADHRRLGIDPVHDRHGDHLRRVSHLGNQTARRCGATFGCMKSKRQTSDDDRPHTGDGIDLMDSRLQTPTFSKRLCRPTIIG